MPETPGRPVPRRRTRVVWVGDVGIGGDHPIRVQSMTTPATTDTAATVAQVARLVEAGCEIVRLTVPTSADADNLPNIRRELAGRGIRVPLVADIHFTPAAAMKAAEHVEKVRINPGNFADKKKFAAREYTDAQYAAELQRIEKAVTPLVRRCRERGIAMRIGTNHGSLSDRIMNRYGDSPEGMVESALEFVRICRGLDYHALVLSMKASNPRVVLEAYRLLVARMDAEGMDYPLHLGVTEAGDGEDARVKSAIGIGALLEDGIGDTVRVSLTEDPVAEIPVARALVEPYNRGNGDVPGSRAPVEVRSTRRPAREVRLGPRRIGGTRPVAVEVALRAPLSDLDALRRELDTQAGVRVPEETRAEVVGVRAETSGDVEACRTLRRSLDLVAPSVSLSLHAPLRLALAAELMGAAHRIHVVLPDPLSPRDRLDLAGLLEAAGPARGALLLEAGSVAVAREAARRAAAAGATEIALALAPRAGVSPLQAYRELAALLGDVPLVLLDRAADRGADPLLGPATALGGLLCEGIGDAIRVEAATAEESRRLAFTILQAARVRITRTEFISCPSCGRTLFDLETTTARIKARTAHLKGVKIAIMGCVVNGPGEMADADFGYVGWGEEKIALFVGREMVARDIPVAEADERLVELIKAHGKWVEPVGA